MKLAMSLIAHEHDTKQTLLQSCQLWRSGALENITLQRRAVQHSDVEYHSINGTKFPIALPLTFTPYASTRACSARCWFCSENFKKKNQKRKASSLRPTEVYFDQLNTILKAIKHIPLGLSLSGLEMTDDATWLTNTLALLGDSKVAPTWTEKACYSNGAGFAKDEH